MPRVELPQAEFKVVLLGDTNTGKTCLVLRFAEGYYKQSERASTIGAFFLTKRVTCNGMTCKMMLWDTAGQEQFCKLAVTYYKNAAAAILCYDVSNPRSLVRLRRWLTELEQNTSRIVTVMAACKGDLEAVPGLEHEAMQLADQVGALYVKTSAKTNEGVHDLFQQTASRVLQWQQEAILNGHAPSLPVTMGRPSHHGSDRGRSLSPIYKHAAAAPSSSPVSPLAGHGRKIIGADTTTTTTITATISPSRDVAAATKESTLTLPKDSTQNSAPAKTTSRKDASEAGISTVADTDDPVLQTSSSEGGKGMMCEGSMLVCGQELDADGSKCTIM